MQIFKSWEEAEREILRFSLEQGANLSGEIKDGLAVIFAMRSPVDKCCRGAELIYAKRDDVNAATRELAASFAAFADEWGVGVYPGPGRYAAISTALRRDAEDGDPMPMPEYSGAALP